MKGDLQAHLSTTSTEWFLTKNSMTPMPHHPYSPNLALSSTFLFPPAEKVLKGKHFADVEEVKQKITEALKGIKISKFKKLF